MEWEGKKFGLTGMGTIFCLLSEGLESVKHSAGCVCGVKD